MGYPVLCPVRMYSVQHGYNIIYTPTVKFLNVDIEELLHGILQKEHVAAVQAEDDGADAYQLCQETCNAPVAEVDACKVFIPEAAGDNLNVALRLVDGSYFDKVFHIVIIFWQLKKLWEVNEVKGQMLMSLVLLVIVSHVIIIVQEIILEVKEVMGS